MITLYRSMPGWTVPCLGPMVTKVAYYMTMTGLKYELKAQDLTQLGRDSPNGKLPWLVDEDGSVHCDSTQIIEHFQKKYGNALDADASPEERATMVAFNRLIDEHLYWPAVVHARYRESRNWEKYVRLIVGSDDVPTEVRDAIEEWRFRVLNGFVNGGWARLPSATLYARARTDIDALSGFLGDKPYFMGNEPRWIDASVLSILRHIIDTPFTFDTKTYASTKKNFASYMRRMKDRYGI